MSDSKLRELERRWKETGSVVDEAAYLLERVRIGDLEKERLELAAYCGHQGAAKAQGTAIDSAELLLRFCSHEHYLAQRPGLGRWGREACARAAFAIARVALGRWSRLVKDGGAAGNVVLAAELWVLDPTKHSASECRLRVDAFYRDWLGAAVSMEPQSERGLAFSALSAIRSAVAVAFGDDPAACVVEAGGYAYWHGTQDVCQAVRDEVSAWCLGCRDPVAERLTNRAQP